MAGKKSRAMWEWLRQEGYTTGNAELLEQGKHAWKQKYYREYHRERRMAKKYLTVSFTPAEVKMITAAARELDLPITSYLQLMALKERQPLSPTLAIAIKEIREELTLIRHNVSDIKELVRSAYGDDVARYMSLAIDRIIFLDQFIRKTLVTSPKRL